VQLEAVEETFDGFVVSRQNRKFLFSAK